MTTAANEAVNGAANDVPQYEFPDFFVNYSKEKLKKNRDVVEYMARFGNRLEKGMALMILAAAGEPWKE